MLPAMPAYVIAEVDVSDPDQYALYQAAVPASLEAHGGRFLARGGETATLEGDWQPKRLVLIEFEMHQRRALERRFARTPALAGRVRFVPMVPYARFLARLAQADVLLDTVHFNGQNTTLEAFAVGTPVVTLPGALQRARHGYGMYRAMGFTDLVAADAEDYARKAVRVATDPQCRATCVHRIVETRGVLYESRAFVDACAAALARMVDTAASGR